MAATLDDLSSKIDSLTTAIQALVTLQQNSNTAQINLGTVWQEKTLFEQLCSFNLAPADAVNYINRMKRGEKPWLDNVVTTS